MMCRLFGRLKTRRAAAASPRADEQPTPVRVVLLGPRGAGKTTIKRSLFTAWKLADPPLGQFEFAPMKLESGPDGYPRATHDEGVWQDGCIVVNGERRDLEVVDTKGELLLAALTPNEATRLMEDSPKLYEWTSSAALLLLVVPPELLTDSSEASRAFDHMVNHVVKLVEANPRAMIGLLYSKSDEYGLPASRSPRIITTARQRRALERLRGRRSGAWRSFVQTVSGEGDRENVAARHRCLELSRELWTRVVHLVNPKLGAIGAYWTVARPPEGEPEGAAERGVLQALVDLHAHLELVEGRPQVRAVPLIAAGILGAASLTFGLSGQMAAVDAKDVAREHVALADSLAGPRPLWPWPDFLATGHAVAVLREQMRKAVAVVRGGPGAVRPDPLDTGPERIDRIVQQPRFQEVATQVEQVRRTTLGVFRDQAALREDPCVKRARALLDGLFELHCFIQLVEPDVRGSVPDEMEDAIAEFLEGLRREPEGRRIARALVAARRTDAGPRWPFLHVDPYDLASTYDRLGPELFDAERDLVASITRLEGPVSSAGPELLIRLEPTPGVSPRLIRLPITETADASVVGLHDSVCALELRDDSEGDQGRTVSFTLRPAWTTASGSDFASERLVVHPLALFSALENELDPCLLLVDDKGDAVSEEDLAVMQRLVDGVRYDRLFLMDR